MRIIVGCEFTGTVRDAFRALGHEAYSCDLLPTESHPEWHYQGDLLTAPQLETFDLGIFFPPCTHICVSGARWFKEKQAEQQEAINFFMFCANLPIKRIAIENPIGIMSTRWRKPDQIIQPWMFGHTESKATCIWLKGLKPLLPTNNVYEAMMKLPLKERTRIHYASPGPDRGKDRSRTYSGIASAMTQWAI